MGRLKIWFHRFARQKKTLLAMLLLLLAAYWFCLPSPLFDSPFSTVLEDRDGHLLGAKIAADGQWRFPEVDTVPTKFATAIIAFEDKRFYSHPGFDPLAFGRAIRQNLAKKRVVSGGSTLSMQVIRLARKGKSRTVLEKLVELVLATRLEIRFTKQEILALYASHAPFGGNVVGIEAASWRYFGKKPGSLSWAETAVLAVLPNSPALIHPGRNRDRLREKRNNLLKKLLGEGKLDSITYELSVEEPLPENPVPLPRLAPHLLDRAFAEKVQGSNLTGARIRSTLDQALQARVAKLAERRCNILKFNEIHNLSVLVLEIKTGNVIAYIGNAPNAGQAHGQDVDIITSSRSTGSILKPFLYCKMLQEGSLLPNALVPDLPTYLNSYRPQNFKDSYDGVVAADQALARSLNVPFIKLLQQHGVEKFHYDLRKLGLTTINRPPRDYGLTLILGGAEATLWDLTSSYASMARRLGRFYENNGRYDPNDCRSASYVVSNTSEAKPVLTEQDEFFPADAIWFTFNAMQELERPDSEGDWQKFESSHRLAWKTGTSIGFRDAWAIGVSSKYAVGVWVGNADGEGRPGLVGVYSAAPLLFEVFDLLPPSPWFNPPYDAMKETVVCKHSGFLALDICPKDTIWAPANAAKSQACPYHRLVHLDATGNWQVNSSCYPAPAIASKPWFALPAAEAYYFKSKNPSYSDPPPFLAACQNTAEGQSTMQMVYPKNASKIHVPIELDGSTGRAVFQIAHSSTNVTIHWHLDGQFVGSTKTFHSLELNPAVGDHWLTAVDETGLRLEVSFSVVGNPQG